MGADKDASEIDSVMVISWCGGVRCQYALARRGPRLRHAWVGVPAIESIAI